MVKKMILCVSIVCVIVLAGYMIEPKNASLSIDEVVSEVVDVSGNEVEITPAPDATEEPTVTESPMETSVPVETTAPSEEETPVVTAKPTERPVATSTPKPTQTPIATATPISTAAPTPTVAPTPAPTPVVVVKECDKAADGKHYFLATSRKADCYNEGAYYDICAWCGVTRNEVPIPKTTHDWYEKFFTTPSCSGNGWLNHICRNCNEVWGEEVLAYGHDYEYVVTRVADCTCEQVTVPTCKVCGWKDRQIWGKKDYNNHVGEWQTVTQEKLNHETWEYETITYEVCSACGSKR